MKKQTPFEKLNERFRERMVERATEEFGDLKFETEWNIFSMAVSTHWEGKMSKKKREQIKEFIRVYELGYTDAMNDL